MNIEEILGNLSSEDIASLQKTAKELLGGTNEKDVPAKTATGTDTFSKVAGLMQKMNTKQDPRYDLIQSLRPLLSPQRQERADKALKIMRLLDLLPLLRESGLLKELF